MRSLRTRGAGAATGLALLLCSAGPALAQEGAPRPGCGYGDDVHSHQAAPGLDPMGLRPGKGTGDTVNPHTFPPGSTMPGQGDPSDPMRGCPPDPRP
jgi:hypothetical protein